MFRILKKIFIGENKTEKNESTRDRETQDRDINKLSEEIEDTNSENKEDSDIAIFPDSDLNVEAPVNKEVLELANSLHGKSKKGDGTLEETENYLLYTKKYDFCTINWVIIDTRIEKRENLRQAYKEATVNWLKEHHSEIQEDRFIWHISEELLSSPLNHTEKGKKLLNLNVELDLNSTLKEEPDSLSSSFSKFKLHELKAHTRGYFEILDKLDKYRSYAICINYFNTKKDLLYHRFYNHFSTHQDPFTNKKILEWDSIGTPSNEYLQLMEEQIGKGFEPRPFITLNDWLYFKLKNINGLDFITFEFNIKEMKLRADDSIFFLLSNGEVVEFNLPEKFYTIEQRVLKGVDVPITQEELKRLSQHEVERIRVHEKSNNFKVDINITDFISEWDMYKEYRQFVIRNLFADHLKQVENIVDDYKPLYVGDINKESSPEEPCHVYLMKDTANDFFKIGISNQPEYREKTLQSEKPTIELLSSKEYPSRTIAESIETALHNTFSTKRLRGEWFELDAKDIEEIKKTLK
ncbi:MAG: GIY-YIG nuclease family protein [Balneolaceae bacterium]|nr:GIY-YIG nuclease family protein [Balneolaceae bacterium]